MARGVGGHSPANLQKHLKGQHYPAKKQDLLKTARSNQASREVLDWIEDLPVEEFEGPQDVMKAFGEEDREKRATDSQSE
jgi:hypothetical protein